MRQIQPFVGQSRDYGKPLLIGGVVLAVLFMISLVVTQHKEEPAMYTPSEIQALQAVTTPNPARQPLISTPTETKIPDHTNYKRGFKAGMEYGRMIAKEPGGIGTEEGIQMSARGSAILSDGTREDIDWQRGWVEGYKKGFTSIRGKGRNEAEFEALSTANALPGMKLYDTDGKYVVTIISADAASGLMTVRYRNGTVEPKRITALSKLWFLKKN